MSKITKSSFIREHSNQKLDLSDLQRSPDKKRVLAQQGLSRGDIARADLDGNGSIEGAREMGALFAQVDRVDNDGSYRSLISVDRAGNATAAGKALNTLGLLMHNRSQRGIQDLQGSVGVRGVNKADDVRAVQQALRDKGFDVAVDGGWGRETQNALRVYASMLNGNESVKDSDGTVRPGSVLQQALASEQAPRWSAMPRSGTGFVNVDTDHFGYGSERTADVIRDAGQRYSDSYLADNTNASLIGVNDVSRRNGGVTRDHDSHQAGLDLDVRLPTKDGGHGSKVGWRNYDRDAAYAMVKSFAQDPRVERVIITDTRLISRAQETGEAWADKVVSGGNLHKNHMHVDMSPAPFEAAG